MFNFHGSDVSHKLSETEAGWGKVGLEEKCLVLLDKLDEGRIDTYGGYPSEYVFSEDKICVATIGYKNQPELIFMKMDEFVAENEWLVFDYFDETSE